MSKKLQIISWTCRMLLFMGFALASLGKITRDPSVIDMFQNWGYPSHFYFIIGIIEISLAILILIPKTVKFAVFGLYIIMIGAVITHLLNDPPIEILRPGIFLILLSVVFMIHNYKRDEQLIIS